MVYYSLNIEWFSLLSNDSEYTLFMNEKYL